MSRIVRIDIREVKRPLSVAFSTALGSKDFIKSVIVSVSLDNGFRGTGECPTSFSLKQETIPNIKKILGRSSNLLLNTTIDEYGFIIKELRGLYPFNPMTVSGLETALFRACLACAGETEFSHWGGAVKCIDTDITIPVIRDVRVLDRWTERFVAKGFSMFKLKTSGNVEADRIFLSHIYEKLKDEKGDFSVRLDGNQGYTEETFFQLLDFILKRGYNVELFEQPLHKTDYAGHREIKKHSPVPIILDETVFTVEDLMRCVEEDCCHGVNIKIAKSGIEESMRVFSTAKAQGMKLMIGCMTETMVGLSAGIYFALGTGGFDYIDLDSVHFLHHRKQYKDISIDGPRYVLADS